MTPTYAAMPRSTAPPSGSVNCIAEAESPKFLIRVTAPAYFGYISKTLASTQLGNVCSLTTNPEEAQEWVEINEKMTSHAGTAAPIYSANRVKGSDHEWLCAVQSRSDGISHRLTFGHYNVPKQRWSLAGEPATRQYSELVLEWNIADDGKITLRARSGLKFVIAKLQDGSLTLTLWSRRFWEEGDDAYVSELHLVRAV